LQKEDTTLPTVSIESALSPLKWTIHDQRDVATTDIPGTLMQADMVREIHVKLESRHAEILAKLYSPLYIKYRPSKMARCVSESVTVQKSQSLILR